jgi:signal transduction histidine kinase
MANNYSVLFLYSQRNMAKISKLITHLESCTEISPIRRSYSEWENLATREPDCVVLYNTPNGIETWYERIQRNFNTLVILVEQTENEMRIGRYNENRLAEIICRGAPYTSNQLFSDYLTGLVMRYKKHINEQERSYELQIENLHRNAAELAQTENLAQVADVTLNTVDRIFGFSAATFGIIKEGKIHFVKSLGVSDEKIKPLPLDGSGITVRAVNSMTTQIVSDTSLDPMYISRYAEARSKIHRSELDVPVIVYDEVVAVINLEHERVNAFNLTDVQLLRILAQHVASAVTRIKAQNNRMEYLKGLEALHAHASLLQSADSLSLVGKISFDIIEDVLGFNVGDFNIIKDDCVKAIYVQGLTFDDYRDLPLSGPGIVVRAARTGLTQYVPDTRLDPDYVTVTVNGAQTISELAVPVKNRGKVVAVINLESEIPDNFSEIDRTLMEVIALHVASAISNIEQRDHLEERVRQRTIELAESNRKLKELDVLKSRFINRATHEIRTPLTSIQGYTELVKSAIASEELASVEDYFDVILKNVHRLIRLTDDLLDLQRLEMNKFDIRSESVNVKDFIDEIQAEVEPVLSSKNQKLTFNLGYQGTIRADRVKLFQVFLNLLSNASKFSSNGSSILVESRLNEDYVIFSVVDEGRGVSQEDVEKLFKPFPGVVSESVPGTGLGLSICKGIVEAHGGKIWVESSGLGDGSRFSFTVPIEG